MSLYAVGDIQGCCAQLQELIATVLRHDPEARWFFVGDLVNRGPQSLQTLQTIRALGARANCLLGNHDLHLLAVSQGVRRASRGDTCEAILQAPDRADLLDWLRQRPLAAFIDGHLLVHAGVLPQWDVQQAMALAQEVESVLRGPDWVDFLREMYGDTPVQWHDNLRGIERLRCIVNALTRLRWCTPNGSMQLKTGKVEQAEHGTYLPWFEVPQRQTAAVTVVFGHWSARGLVLQPNLLGLDSGCIWGGKLSALRLSDRALFQVNCPQFQTPGE